MRNNKYTNALLAPSNRPFLFVGGAVVLAVIVASIIFSVVTADDDEGANAPLQATPADSPVDVGAEKSDAYVEAVEEKNKKNYDAATKTKNGVHIPFVIDGKKPEPVGGNDANVATCGCTMSDEEFHARLSRAGVEFDSANDLITQIGESDIYVAADRYLVSKDKQKLKFHGQDIKLADSGNIVWSDNQAVELQNVGELFLSVDGELIDSETQLIPMRGQLLTHDGIVYLANGKHAYRPGNMAQVHSTDIYLTSESQLVTVDARPIRHSGNFVFRNREREITDSRGVPARWEDAVVFQSNIGHLVNNKGKLFDKPGILFSYNGIMIDNQGMLTKPLINLRRFGESDLLLDDSGNLKDRFSGDVTNYGEPVELGIGQRLLSGSSDVLNHKKAPVLLEDDGRLSVDIGKGSVQSGLLKNSNGVAYDRNGHLLSRPGKLTQKATSDVFIASDGLLASNEGKPLLFNGKDMFLDFNSYLPGNLIGLRTYDSVVVTDKQGNKLYLNELGQFVTEDNELAQVDVSITSSDGVVVAPTGELMIDKNARKPVLTKNGEQLLYNGKPVFEGPNGQLFDAQGNPILDENGGPLRLNEQGFIVDENGELSYMDGFTTKNGKVDTAKHSFDTIKPLLGPDGKQIYRNGKPVFRKGNMLLDENGNQLRDESGSLLTIGPDGKVRNQFGVEDEQLNEQLSGKPGDMELFTANGKPVMVNGEKVYRRPDGSLVNADGEPVLTADGEPVYMDENGNIVDKSGQPITETLFTDESGKAISNDALDTPLGANELVTKNGKPLTHNGKKVYRQPDGSLVYADGKPVTTEDGEPVYLDENGNVVDSSGRQIEEPMFKDENGNTVSNTGLDTPGTPNELVTLNGKPLKHNGKQVYRRPDGKLVYADGSPVKDKSGRELHLDDNMQLRDGSGRKVDSPWAEGNLSTVPNGGFKSVNPLGKTYESGFVKTPNGYLLDKNGKPITYKGKNVRVGEDGRIYDENGELITDSEGNPLYMNDRGEIITEDGKHLDEPIFADGEGRLLFGDGKPVTSAMKRIGESDVFITRDGKLLDKDGKPFTHNGKAIEIDPETGRLVDEDGNPLRDPRGNSLYLSDQGEFITKDGKKARGFNPVNADGVGLGSDGKLLAGSNALTKIPGTDYYKTEDGLVVDENGRPVTQNGKQFYVNDNNELVDRLGRPIRYKGQRLRLDGRGQVVGANGDSIIVDDKPVTLNDLDSLIRPNIVEDENNVTPPALPDEQVPTEAEPQVQDETDEDSVSTSGEQEPETDDGKIKLSKVDQAARARFGSRLQSYMSAMKQTTNEYSELINPTYQPSAVTASQQGGANPGDNATGLESAQQTANADSAGGDNSGGAIVEPTGTTFFVVSTHAMNTDFNDRLEVELHMPFPDHPLHKAKAYAQVELVYDNAVLKFYEICPLDSQCFTIEGLGLDPATASAGMAAEVEDHFWYRFGGVFLASFGTGVADGISQSQDRTQITDSIPGSTQTTTVVEGLNYAEIALQGVGEVGRALMPSFAERVNRPVTVKIPKNTEMVLKIFGHITEKDFPDTHLADY